MIPKDYKVRLHVGDYAVHLRRDMKLLAALRIALDGAIFLSSVLLLGLMLSTIFFGLFIFTN